jgi:hypothetical protein
MAEVKSWVSSLVVVFSFYSHILIVQKGFNVTFPYIPIKIHPFSWVQWLIPIILATWEAEFGRITVRGLTEEKVCETPSQPMKSWAWWLTPLTPAMREA